MDWWAHQKATIQSSQLSDLSFGRKKQTSGFFCCTLKDFFVRRRAQRFALKIEG
jgi:hypothetical protein